jgi:hypothetical protein
MVQGTLVEAAASAAGVRIRPPTRGTTDRPSEETM